MKDPFSDSMFVWQSVGSRIGASICWILPGPWALGSKEATLALGALLWDQGQYVGHPGSPGKRNPDQETSGFV